MCKCYLYENFNDIYIALNDINNDDMYPDHTWKVNWDNLTEIVIYVANKQFCLSSNMLKYMANYAKSTVGKNSYEYVDKIHEYASLISELINFGF